MNNFSAASWNLSDLEIESRIGFATISVNLSSEPRPRGGPRTGLRALSLWEWVRDLAAFFFERLTG